MRTVKYTIAATLCTLVDTIPDKSPAYVESLPGLIVRKVLFLFNR